MMAPIGQILFPVSKKSQQADTTHWRSRSQQVLQPWAMYLPGAIILIVNAVATHQPQISPLTTQMVITNSLFNAQKLQPEAFIQ